VVPRAWLRRSDHGGYSSIPISPCQEMTLAYSRSTIISTGPGVLLAAIPLHMLLCFGLKNLREAGWSAANRSTIMVRRSGEMKK
jgi:hypothetical protein